MRHRQLNFNNIPWFILLTAMAGLGLAMTSKSPAAAQLNSLVMSPDSQAVYLLYHNQRYVFPNEKTYNSWYQDFSQVRSVSAVELASYPLKGNVCYWPGQRLVKITADPRVYWVAPDCVLRHIISETSAMELFGSDWAQKVDDLPDVFFVNYQIGPPLADSSLPQLSGLDSPLAGLPSAAGAPADQPSPAPDGPADKPAIDGSWPHSQPIDIDTDAMSPSDQVMAAGANGQVVGQLSLTARIEAAEVTALTVHITAINGGGFDELDKLYVYDGSSLLGAQMPTSLSTKINLDPGLVIPAHQSKKLTIRADLAGIGAGLPADSGQGFSLSLTGDDIEARGVISGASLGSDRKQGVFTSAKIIIHQSKPTLSRLNPLTSLLVDGSDVPVYRFSIAADPKGDIGFYKASFLYSESGVTASNFKLWENPDSYNLDLTADGGRAADETIGTESKLNILFSTSGSSTASGGELKLIPAGQNYTYELQSSITGTSAGDTFSMRMIADPALPPTSPATASDLDSQAYDNFIWSDLHLSKSATATSTTQWFNSYLVFTTTTATVLSR